MDLEALRTLLRALPEHERKVQLSFDGAAFDLARLAVGGGVGILVLQCVLVLLHPTGGELFAPSTLLAGGLLGAVVTVARQWGSQGQVTVVVDEDAIRELDGEVVRVAIPWSQVRLHALQWRFARRGLGVFNSSELTFVAPDGELIAMTNRDPHRLLPRPQFRRFTRFSLVGLAGLAPTLGALERPPSDPRWARRGGLFLHFLSWLGGAGLGCGLFLGFLVGGRPASDQWLAAGVLSFSAAAWCLQPAVWWRRSRAALKVAAAASRPWALLDAARARRSLVGRLVAAALALVAPLLAWAQSR